MRDRRPAARTALTALTALTGLALAGCAADDGGTTDDDVTAEATDEATGEGDLGLEPGDLGAGQPLAAANLQDVDGNDVGTATFRESGGVIEVTVVVAGLEPGFHGLHVHAVGECEPESSPPDDPSRTGAFLSAGGHLGGDGADHGAHIGDLPSLYVGESGDGRLITSTDRLTADDLLDDDRSAVIVHGDRDNFAHIPERYAPDGPDEATLGTGDAGDRIACGVVG